MFPNPYVLLAAVAAALVLSASSFYGGHHWATTKAEAERAKQADQHIKQLHAAVAHGNEVAAKLAAAEGRVITRTVEVIKHVPQVTVGRLCLDAGAVSLLNPAPATPDPAAREPDGESPAHAAAPGGNAASDTDIAYWIADANRQYETAAARLNALIDFNQTQKELQ